MNGWILVGEKSACLHDLITFVDTFEAMDFPLKKVLVTDISVFSTNTSTIYVNGKETAPPDFAIAAFFGNNDYHNRSVVKMLESIGVFCINNYSCLIDTCDKLKSFQLVKENVPSAILPKTLLFDSTITSDFLTQAIGFPLIAKINHGAKGDGVFLVKDINCLEQTIYSLEQAFDDTIIIQEYIEHSKGMDLRIIVCGGKIITSFVRINESDFKSNLATGGHIEFFDIPQALACTAIEIANALSINLGSVDFLFGENHEFLLCEANSMPGLSYVKASGDCGIGNPLEDIVENIKAQVLAKMK